MARKTKPQKTKHKIRQYILAADKVLAYYWSQGAFSRAMKEVTASHDREESLKKRLEAVKSKLAKAEDATKKIALVTSQSVEQKTANSAVPANVKVEEGSSSDWD